MPRSGSKSSPSSPRGDRLEGRNVVHEALKAGRALRWIAIDERARVNRKLERILALATERGVPVRHVPRIDLDRESLTGSHNGVVAEAEVAPAVPLEEIFRSDGAPPCVVALGARHSAEERGAVIRTALAAGATAIVVPPGEGPVLDAVTRRVSMGASEHVRTARASYGDVAAAARKAGLRVLCLASAAEDPAGKDWHDADLTGPVVLVLDEGSRALQPDALLRLPPGELAATSLAAALLYERERQSRSFSR